MKTAAIAVFVVTIVLSGQAPMVAAVFFIAAVLLVLGG